MNSSVFFFPTKKKHISNKFGFNKEKHFFFFFFFCFERETYLIWCDNLNALTQPEFLGLMQQWLENIKNSLFTKKKKKGSLEV